MESTHDSSCRTVQTLRVTAHRPTAASRHPAPHRRCSRPSKTLLLTTASCPRPSMERKDSKDVHVWPLVYQAENLNARRERNVARRRILPIPVEGSEVAESSRFGEGRDTLQTAFPATTTSRSVVGSAQCGCVPAGRCAYMRRRS
jgi:hypothetical protein